jgi:hypothetical protein
MKRSMLLILPAFALWLASCGNKDSGNYELTIPKDASVVMHINGASLSSKISWEEISQSNWFKEMSKHTKDSAARQILSNPAISGINTKADVFLYSKQQQGGSYSIVTGSLVDAAAFEKFCISVDKEGSKEVKKENGFSYLTSGDGAVVWNTGHFAFTGNASMPTPGKFIKPKRFFDDKPSLKTEYSADSLRLFAMEALTPKSKDNLEADSRFAALIKDGRDFHFWLNSGSLYSGMNAMSPLPLGDLIEGNASAFSMNFDNGKISVKIKQYYGDKIGKVLANNPAEPISAAMINRIPSSNVVGVLAFNYVPSAIKDLLKTIPSASESIDMVLANGDFSINDFVKANKGQVLISLSDPNTEMKQSPVAGKKNKGGDMHDKPQMKTTFKVLFATAVNDKAAFEKMVTMAWDMVKKIKGAGRVPTTNNDLPFSYKVENNWFAASNSAEFTDKFLAGGDNKLPFTDKIAGHPFGMYLDLQKLMASMHSKINPADSSNKKGLTEAMNMWQDILATGGGYKDGASQFDVDVNLVDKNTNSLKQLNRYFDETLAIHQARKKLEIKDITLTDSVQEEDIVKPPPPPAKKKATK